MNVASPVEGSSYVLVAGMIGAAGGGFWTGLAFERLISSVGTLLDLMALLVAGLLTLAIAWYVHRASGRLALIVYLTIAGAAALIGPALVF